MAASGRRSAVPFVLCLLAVAALGFLAWTSDSHPVIVALLVAIPLFAAVFLSPALTALVGILVLAVAGALAALVPDTQVSDYLVPLIAIAVAVVVAIVAAMLRRPSESPASMSTSPEGHGSGALGEPPSVDSDPMTGLLNRRGAIRVLGTTNTSTVRVLAFLDCDLFRAVNETYGTEIGDEFLQAIAGRLRHSLPAHDTVARWEGDEFLVVMSTDAVTALPALERVIASINGHPVRTEAGPIEASMSVGAAVWLTGQDLEDAISRAGGALLTAKSGGRGQIVLDPGAPADPTPSGSAGSAGGTPSSPA